MSSDALTITTIEVTPDGVEAEAKRFALRTGGLLLLAMAERGISEEQLADMLQVPRTQVLNMLRGKGYRAYLPLAALCLALGVRMDLRADVRASQG
ncbi:helix-turn-helix domain-containing protein [Roseococcus sp.]|uniref:helix-turn-helix domain-containing protein n=1 Tax=Roseococcus sp. TaxID=2109646 RepID=UPI003BAB2751